MFLRQRMVLRQRKHQRLTSDPFNSEFLVIHRQRHKTDIDTAFTQTSNLQIGVEASQHQMNVGILSRKSAQDIHNSSKETALRRSDGSYPQLSDFTFTGANCKFRSRFRMS